MRRYYFLRRKRKDIPFRISCIGSCIHVYILAWNRSFWGGRGEGIKSTWEGKERDKRYKYIALVIEFRESI